MIELIGYVASAGAATMWVPQAVRAFRHRRDVRALSGVSVTTYAVAIVFNALLLTYGVHHRAGPVWVAGGVNLACATTIVATVLTARRRVGRGTEVPS